MVLTKHFFSLLCVALSTHAAPTESHTGVISLDFDIHDKQQDGTFAKRSGSGPYYEGYKNTQQMYVAQIKIGSNKQKVSLQIDTGSSDLWVPSHNTAGFTMGTFNAEKSTTFNPLDEEFFIQYGDSTYGAGVYAEDTVYFGSKSVAELPKLQFGFVNDTNVTVSGLLGIGLESLEASMSFNGTADVGDEYINFPVAMKNAGYISTVSYSIFMTSKNAKSGTILFGGKDLAKINGTLVRLPHSGLTEYLSVTLDSVTLGGHSIPVNTSVLLDSGTTLTYLPAFTVDSIVMKLGGDLSVDSQGLFLVPCQATGTLSYVFDGITIDVPVSDLIFKDAGGTCSIGILEGEEDSIILGDNFLQYVYAYYDLEDSSISLGHVQYTKKSNIVAT